MSSYWQRRQDQLDSSLEKDEAALKKRLLKAYEREAAKLDKEIAAYYQKYGRDNVIEYARLFEQLSADDIKLLIERMDDFAKKYPQYADLMPVRESVYKLNRLEGLKESVLLHQYEIGAITNAQLQEHLSKLYFTNSKAAAKAVGLTENESIIKNFVNTAWTGSKDYSQRIWQNADKLAEYLNNDIAQGFARGDSYERLTQQVRSRFINVSKNDAYRLIYTEGTYVMNEAQARIFEQDFEEYEYLTAGDGKVCSVCSALSGRRFRFSQRQQGANFPPMHPWCRCHFNPVVDDWDKWLDDYEKRHGSAGNRLQDIFKDDTIKTTKISQQVLDNLRSPDLDFLTKVQNETLRQGMKNLLKRVDGTPEGTECAYYYDMRAKFLKWEMGEPGKSSVNVYNPRVDYITMHNHPSGGTFSPGDIGSFVKNDNMRAILIVGNNGEQYILQRDQSFDRDNFSKDYADYLYKLRDQDIDLVEILNLANDFLEKGASRYGYKYRKIIS